MEAVQPLQIETLNVHKDSSLRMNQITVRWKVKSGDLALYQAHLEKIMSYSDELKFMYL